MSKLIVMATPECVELAPSFIPSEWIISGTPKAWNKEVSTSHDRISQIVVWECSSGHFKWHYHKDESVIVISGEAFLINSDGQELRFGAGDVGFFPAGSICTWRVPGRFRKVAVLREPMWRPLGWATKACNRLTGVVGMRGESTLVSLDTARLGSTAR